MHHLEKQLSAVAQQLSDLKMLDGDFIHEQDISAKDIVSLWSGAAAIIRGFLAAPKEIQQAIEVAGAIYTDPQTRPLNPFLFESAMTSYLTRKAVPDLLKEVEEDK